MFGLFKGIFKKSSDAAPSKTEQDRQVVLAANKIACDFSDLMASDRFEPQMIYDVSVLPYPKGIIEKSCKLWISVCRDESQLRAWKCVLPNLSQFQEGIGPTPLGIDSASLTADLPLKEMAARMTSLNMPSPELVHKVQNEAQALLDWARQVVDGRL